VWDGRDESGRVPVLQAPRYAYAFTDEGGNVTRNEAPLPQVEADIKPEVTGNRVRIVGIRYRGRAVGLTEDHREVLARAAKFIARHPESTLTLEGYADVPGDDEANFEIAKERAERVLRSLLSDHGLAATRVSVRVYGRSRNAPRYDSIPEEEQNQRVDLVIHVRR
jgi:outer membrane protein OmpA-like peptidoglycan-associated protein